MSKYIKNLWYVVQHKWFVLIECWKEGLYWQGIIHDLSKFSVTEFYAYTWNFFALPVERTDTGDTYKTLFQYAWLHHQHHNKHHWNYWVVNQMKQEALPMPEKYVREMICDWRAMSRKFGDTAEEYFCKHRHNMVLHPQTFQRVEELLLPGGKSAC